MTPKLILVSGLACNGGEDVDKVSCAMKAQLQCLPMPEVATSAGECPSGHGMGPWGGYSRVLCLQTVLSSRPMDEAAQLCCSNSCLGMLRGAVVVVTVALGICRAVTLEKTKPRWRSLCGAVMWGSDVGQGSSALLHIWCWCPARHRAGCLWVPRSEASNRWETTEELRTSRCRCAPDACSNLLTKHGWESSAAEQWGCAGSS